jgi:hypothetical protein
MNREHGKPIMKKISCLTSIAMVATLSTFAIVPAAAQAPAKPAAAASAKPAPSGKQRTYATPEEAVKSFVDAVRATDLKALAAIIGPGSEAWITTGDAVQDEQDRKRFLAAFDEKNALEKKGENSLILAIGVDAWPFAVPIVKKGSQWAFDAKAGREEITNRRVGRNELETIKTLRAVVEAQRKYASADADGNGVADYARRFMSSDGRKDGLYWPTKEGEPASPLGALVEVAAAEGYGKKASSGAPQPYQGYYYRMLTAQGKDASGGAKDYLVKDKLTGGFAVVAYPSKYDVSGIMTFIVNNEGVVYEKDLGKNTPAIAGKMKLFSPDKTWAKSP